jgi:RNA polymerase sigma-70 factor (ECF subfamily)
MPDGDHLLADARAGDDHALGQLLERYRGYLTLLARLQISRRLQGKVDASDLVQSTFLEAYRHFGGFRGTSDGEFAGWLRQILAGVVANVVRHYAGTRRRDVALERELEAELERSSQRLDGGLVAPGTTPSERAARCEEAVRLAALLEDLPEDYREVLILHHVEGSSLPEVARTLGRTVDSVKKLWLRALGRLRAALGNRP